MAASLLGFQSSVSRAWRKYNISLKQSPIATKAVTCMAAYAIGDLTAQVFSNKTTGLHRRLASVDGSRLGRAALYGLLWCGPACHSFYSGLDRVFARQASSSVTSIAGKVAADQLLFAPICTAVFFAWSNLASGTAANIPSDLKEKLPSSVKAAWALWVPAMTINMAVVPPELRILFINAVSIVWTNILSTMAGDVAPAPPVDMPANIDLEAESNAAPTELSLATMPLLSLLCPARRVSASISERSAGKRGQARVSDQLIPPAMVQRGVDDNLASLLFSASGALPANEDEEGVDECDAFYNSVCDTPHSPIAVLAF